jgi:hypothetical protein
MSEKAEISIPLKKEAINNNDSYPFAWQLGEPDTNVILEHKGLNVQLLRYLIKSPDSDVLYDGFAIKEAPNNTVTVIRNQSKELCLVYEWRPIPEKWFWACVRGFADPNDEDNIAAGKREMIEEIGHCTIINHRKLGALYQNTTFYENPVGLVLLEVELIDQQTSHEEGIVDFKFFTKEEIMTMIHEDKIEDTFTLSALMKYFAAEESI